MPAEAALARAGASPPQPDRRRGRPPAAIASGSLDGATPASGLPGDAFGLRRVLRGALRPLGLSTIACVSAAAPMSVRLCPGPAGGAVLNANVALAAKAFPAGRRARVVNWMTVCFVIATLTSPIIGGFAADRPPLASAGLGVAPWRLLLLAQAPATPAAALLAGDEWAPAPWAPSRAPGFATAPAAPLLAIALAVTMDLPRGLVLRGSGG